MSMFTRTGRIAKAALPFDARTDAIMQKMDGSKTRLKNNMVSFTDSAKNLALVREHFPQIPIELPQDLSVRHGRKDVPIGAFDQCKDPLRYAHQTEAFERCKDKEYFGLFMEQGTGKTRVAIDKAARHFCRGEITGLLVITFKGVHRQWAEQQIPQHLGTLNGAKIKTDIYIWENKHIHFKPVQPGKLMIFCATFSSATTAAGKQSIEDFCMQHHGALMTVLDESHAIKTYDSQRTEACVSIGLASRYRLIMTGTPIPAKLEDEWSQSMFLSESIFGHRFVSSFRAEYVRDSDIDYDPENDPEPAHVTKFREAMAPHIFRVTKDEALDLPPKIMEQYFFDLGAKARKAYVDLRKNFLVDLKELAAVAHANPLAVAALEAAGENTANITVMPEAITVQNAAVLLMRLQQITCGLLVGEKDEVTKAAGYEVVVGTERLDALAELLTSKFVQEKKIAIWARFTCDIESIIAYVHAKKLGKAVPYHGGVKNFDANRKAFMEDPSVRFFVGNTAKGGAGLNLQGECRTVIYYSNSFNSVDRWQSEDRFHRIGTVHAVTYFDLIARQTVDDALLKNLRAKKSFADVVLRTLEESDV